MIGKNKPPDNKLESDNNKWIVLEWKWDSKINS